MKFKGNPIHVCNEVPKNTSYLIPMSMKFCPFCGEETTKYDTEEFLDGKGRTRNSSPCGTWEGFPKNK